MLIELAQAHWNIQPGRVPTLGIRTTSKMPSPTTVRGFLESMCGDSGVFQGELAYALVKGPIGQGNLLRVSNVINSVGEATRPVWWETLFGIQLRIAVRGPYVERAILGMKGELDRYGVLTLGTSYDAVVGVWENDTIPAQWVVPGMAFPLIVDRTFGFQNQNPTYKMFDLSESLAAPPENAWMDLSHK